MMMTMSRHNERGMALLVVLWGCTLAAITLGALASSARVEGVQARGQTLRVRGFYAAEAGIEQAVYRLRAEQAFQRWAVDGRTYRLRVDDVAVSVAIADEDGKINLNQATPEQIVALLQAAGVDSDRAPRLRDAMVDWGNRGKLFVDALLAKGGFASLEELQRVPGMSADLVARIEPALTLWSTSGPNLAHAPAIVVTAVTGASREASEAYVAGVREMNPANNVLPLPPGNVEPDLLSIPTSGTVTIVSTANISGGLAVKIEATVLLKNVPGETRAYRVLRWRESSAAGEAIASSSRDHPL